MVNPIQRRPKMSQAFTLIELLVVISIISLLVSILLPALAAARVSAQATQSLANVRQITFAFHAYGADNKSQLPYSNWDSRSTSQAPWAVRLTGIPSIGPFTVRTGTPYINTPHIFWSPARLRLGGYPATTGNPNDVRWDYTGYGVNQYGVMPRELDSTGTVAPINLDHARNKPLSKLLMLAESFRPSQLPAIDGRFDLVASASGIYCYRGVAVRSYVDGHATQRDPIDLLWRVTGRGGYDGVWTSTAATARNPEPYYRQ
jgi:prepilin-type N-terminal cleavage/methylation domain-containing protein